jgi:hypothetical protein
MEPTLKKYFNKTVILGNYKFKKYSMKYRFIIL